MSYIYYLNQVAAFTVYTCVCACVCVCVHVCVCLCVHVCICVYVCVCVPGMGQSTCEST